MTAASSSAWLAPTAGCAYAGHRRRDGTLPRSAHTSATHRGSRITRSSAARPRGSYDTTLTRTCRPGLPVQAGAERKMAYSPHRAQDQRVDHRPVTDLDGTGKTQIDTSVPFYNHMMTALGKHSLIDLNIKAGDTDIDVHHTVEDTAIVFGEAPAPPLTTNAASVVSPTRPRWTRRSPRQSSTSPAVRTWCAPESRKASNTA